VDNQLKMSAETKAKLQDSVRGVTEIFETQRGISFSRLPTWALSQFAQVENISKVSSQLSVRDLRSSQAQVKSPFNIDQHAIQLRKSTGLAVLQPSLLRQVILKKAFLIPMVTFESGKALRSMKLLKVKIR
jgi:hypothetical protein